MNEIPQRRVCSAFQRAIELVGRRWAGAILQALGGGALRFAAIRCGVPDLTPRMLTERLREMEEAGIVERRVFPERPPRVEYRLTEMGRALLAALEPLGEWAQRWMPLESAGAPEGEVEVVAEVG